MQNLPEGLIYLLVLGFAYLANYLFNRFISKLEPQPSSVEPDNDQMALEPIPGGLAAASTALATTLPGMTSVAAKTVIAGKLGVQTSRRTRMESKRNLQTAVAMATILGPCKAFEPDENPATSGR